MYQRITEAADFIRKNITREPLVGMITGTGLSSLTDAITIDRSIPYSQIPHFPRATVPGHAGMLVSGSMAGKPVLAMQGRFHLYEGYTVKQITFPVRVMAILGAKYLFISSAAGGLNPHFKPGELMLVSDHINLTGTNPLVGRDLEEFGLSFSDMTSAYSKDLISLARQEAVGAGISLNQGVYVGITGPSLETPAETRFLRSIGSDAVGMSTVNEVIAAVHSGLKVLAIVAITNVNLPDCMTGTSIEEVLANAEKASPSLARLFTLILGSLEQ
jgi:purine-nucleoside phosphorylase